MSLVIQGCVCIVGRVPYVLFDKYLGDVTSLPNDTWVGIIS